MTSNTRFSMAVHILTALAYLDKKASSEQLSETVRTNPVVVRRILGDLNQAGLIRSDRGATGGFLLARGADKISLLDIYHAVMGEEKLVGLHDNPQNPACPVSCNVRGELSRHLQKAQTKFEQELAKVTLSDLEKAM